MKFWKLCAGLLAGFFCISSAQAGLLFTIVEVGPDIKVTVSGSIDTTGWNLQSITGPNPFLREDSIAVGTTNMQRVDGNILAVSGGASTSRVFPPLLGFNQPVSGSATGQTVHFQMTGTGTNWILYLPANYVSGSAVSGSAIYANKSYASLGMVKNETLWTWHLDGIAGSDAKAVTVWATPEPTSMAMWGIGATAATWVRRRRRNAQQS